MTHTAKSRSLERKAIRRAIRRRNRTPEEKAAQRAAWFANFGDDHVAAAEARQLLLKQQIAEHRILEQRADRHIARRAAIAWEKEFRDAWEDAEPFPTTYQVAINQGNIDPFAVEMTSEEGAAAVAAAVVSQRQAVTQEESYLPMVDGFSNPVEIQKCVVCK